MIVSSGRGVHEALAAADLCGAGVVDMPSIDDQLLLELYDSGKALFFAEQNNGYIWQNFLRCSIAIAGALSISAGFSRSIRWTPTAAPVPSTPARMRS